MAAAPRNVNWGAFWMGPGEQIGRGKEAEVRSFGADVIKLYPAGRGADAVAREALTLELAHRLGLPVPALRETGVYTGRHGLVMERVNGPTMGAIMRDTPAGVPRLIGEMVDVQARLLACSGVGLPPLRAKLSRAFDAVFSDPVERAAWLARLKALPDGHALCHGDFHPFNLVRRQNSWIVLDWPDASAGPPAADLARTHLLLHLHDPDLGQLYVDTVTRGKIATGLQAWTPILAAARLAEGVPDQSATLRSLAGLTSR